MITVYKWILGSITLLGALKQQSIDIQGFFKTKHPRNIYMHHYESVHERKKFKGKLCAYPSTYNNLYKYLTHTTLDNFLYIRI
jgi:hypothetical protein